MRVSRAGEGEGAGAGAGAGEGVKRELTSRPELLSLATMSAWAVVSCRLPLPRPFAGLFGGFTPPASPANGLVGALLTRKGICGEMCLAKVFQSCDWMLV